MEREPILITDKDKALCVFHSFESLMTAFLALFPEGNISWDSTGLTAKVSYEGEFMQEDGSYIRFTEEIKNKTGG